MDSILRSVAKQIGIQEEQEFFDDQLIFEINSAIDYISHIGYTREGGFEVKGPEETWSEYLANASEGQFLIKSLIQKKVQLAYDPPMSGSVIESLKNQIKELEWRVYIILDKGSE